MIQSGNYAKINVLQDAEAFSFILSLHSLLQVSMGRKTNWGWDRNSEGIEREGRDSDGK